MLQAHPCQCLSLYIIQSEADLVCEKSMLVTCLFSFNVKMSKHATPSEHTTQRLADQRHAD
jgi:hypothetical protein